MAGLQTVLVFLGVMGLLIDRQSVAMCPEDCKCIARKMLVDCAHRDMLKIPIAEIPNGTKSLVLDKNDISEFGDGALSRLAPWLRKLSLADNILGGFSNTTLATLWRLKILDLSGNLLSDLPQMTSPFLQKLTLSRNDLGYVNANTFQGLSRLRELYLDQCSILYIEEGTFSNLPSLKKLSLEENFIDVDPGGWFVRAPLQELHLSQNRIPLTIPVTKWFGINGASNLRHLALAGNDIQHLEKGVFSDLDSLEVLDLRDNRLTSIGRNDFLSLGNLLELRLDENSLTAIHEESLLPTPELLVLTLDRNQLKSIPLHLFSNPSHITNLGVAFNSLEDISDLNSLPALLSLDLSNNRLLKLPNIQNLTSLEKLDLSHNQIRSIDGGALQHNRNLQEIYLEQNDLVFLDHELLEGLQSLHTLTLGSNSWWCDCRLVWMQDLMWSDEQPPWAEFLADEITCTKPEMLKGEYLKYVSREGLQQQCTNFQIGLALIVVISVWFFILGFFIARFWIQKYMNYRKFKRHVRKNMHYNRQSSRRRKLGVIKWPGHILPASTEFSSDHREISFPLQRKGRFYLEIDTFDPHLDNVFRDNDRDSETIL